MPERADQLYAAATDLFIERGYRDVDVADITARCGVSHGTFYNYFRSKRDLLESVQSRTVQELSAAVAGEREPTAWTSRTEYVAEFTDRARRAVTYIAKNRALVSFVAIAAPGVDERAYESVVAAYDELGAQVTAFLEAGRRQGWIRDSVDLRVAGQAVVSCVLMATFPMLVGDGTDVDPEPIAQACAAFLLGGLRRVLPGA
ncbi:TetR/AcrR family transcriptional regulator [Mycolicibacterium mucogenicum]|uniref:TetR/AcrR family transcriptional regulator n=1 Tax=Mycolicibacterium mucogenicum TaxID=56689 RepID=UPI00226AB08F|nr:TetR/AcrR family transcriptional regulator [Mycolicibacterium mucogenicum]MCX8561487.1 TetR/AcrR family transcriptional regulator [Mycolicibacterium mucogenicum]